MKQQEIDSIKHLIMSQDINHVELGIIIARKKKLPVKYIDEWSMVRYEAHDWNNEHRDLFNKYFIIRKSVDKFYRWKKEAVIDT